MSGQSPTDSPERESRCPFAVGRRNSQEPIAEPKPVPAIGLAQLLKEGTAELHDQAENAAFQTRMVGGKLDRAEFTEFLNQVLIVHRALDPLLIDASAADGRIAAMLLPEHRRVPRIEGDIERLGGSIGSEPLRSTRRFVDFVRKAAVDDPVALVGVLYVNEGATNGNKVVAKRVRDGIGLEKDFALDYLDPHGPDQRKRWMAFKAGLDELDMSEPERQSCLEAARATFRLFMEMSAEFDAVAAER